MSKKRKAMKNKKNRRIKIRNDKTSYLIKWLEYSHSNNKWIKTKNMNNVKEIIRKFLNKSSTKNDKCVNKHRRWDENSSMHFFQTFFHEIIFITDFNETLMKQEKIVFFIYLKKNLFISYSRDLEKSRIYRREFELELETRQHHRRLRFRFCFLSHHHHRRRFFFFFFFFFLFLLEIWERRQLRDVDARSSLRRKTRIDLDVSARALVEFVDFINALINIALNDMSESLDLW
jgi:hypothetical protein